MSISKLLFFYTEIILYLYIMAAEVVPDFDMRIVYDPVVKPSVCARYVKKGIHAYLKSKLFSQTAIDELMGSIKRGELPYYGYEVDRASPYLLYKAVLEPFGVAPADITTENVHATTLVSFHVHIVNDTTIRIHLIPTITNTFTFVQDPFTTLPVEDIRDPNGLIHVYVRKLVSEIYAISRIKPFIIGQMFTVSYDVVFNRSVDARGGDFHRDNSKFGTNFNFLTLEYFMDEHAICFSPELIAAFPPRPGGTIIPPNDIIEFLRNSTTRKDFRMLTQDGTTICFDNLYCVHATPLVTNKAITNPDGSRTVFYPFPPHQVTEQIVDPDTGETREVTTIVHRRADEKTRAVYELLARTPKDMSQSQSSQGSDVSAYDSTDDEVNLDQASFVVPGIQSVYPYTATLDADATIDKLPPVIAITELQSLDYEDPHSEFIANKRSEFVERTPVSVLSQFVDNTRIVRRSFLRGSWYLTKETVEMFAATGNVFPIPPEWAPIPVIQFDPLNETQHLVGGAGSGSVTSPRATYKIDQGLPEQTIELPNLLIKYDNMYLMHPFDMIPATKKGVSVYLQKEQDFVKEVKKHKFKKGGRKNKKSKNKKTKKRSKKQTRKLTKVTS